MALLCTQLLLMSSSVRGRQGATLLESWVLGLTSPIVASAGWIGGLFRDAWDWTAGLVDARRRNIELRAELLETQAELRSQREAVQENRRLKELLGMRTELVSESVGASVVSVNFSGGDRALIIDRGTRDGLRADLPVLAWGAAAGKVVAAYPRRSKVRLLTDPNSGVAGLVQRSRAQGIVFGTGGDALELQYVARFSDVVVGDRVVTSAADGIFPRGVGIGRVSLVQENDDGTQSIELEPEIDFNGLEEVLVLLESSGGGLEPPDLTERR